MSVRFYMDAHVRGEITAALRSRGLDVLTAQVDGAADWDDPELLDRATQLGRAFVSNDTDLLAEAARRQREAIDFAGVIYWHPLRVSIGQAVGDLELIGKVSEPEDLANRVEYLPL